MTNDTRPPFLASVGVGFLLAAVIVLSLAYLGAEAGSWWAMAGLP